MAAAFYNQLAGSGGFSAGTEPYERVHPEVAEVMKEEGIDLSGVKPQLLTPELAAQADLLITMGCREACPFVPRLKREDWALADPKGKPIDEVRTIRDEIKSRVQALIERATNDDHG
ncbi:MAG: arsenate reductase ArsC [Cyanobacteria bacterium]|nr:arsenate reductase ArsC [Cyanobacteriota bacterium]